MTGGRTIEADLTWTGERFEAGVQIEIDAAGQITRVGGLGRPDATRLTGRALLPGFVNAHSHAFQRGLRGHGETFAEGAGSFWSWREAMYALVEELDADRFETLTRRAFEEMLAAGITTVGEFHYLHHDHTNEGFAFDGRVLRAAAAAGIRIVLLNAYYRTGGFDAPLSGGQRRFGCPDLETYWSQMDRLLEGIDPDRQSLGAVAHSIRAVPIEEIAELAAEAECRGLVLHMHVEEQPREIAACVSQYGHTPMALLNEHVLITPRFTAVHCTHTTASDLRGFLAAGGNVCICPITEANLGDGLADLATVAGAGGRVCVGTDSNSRLCMLEEMRWLEYGQRLRGGTRGVWVDEKGRAARALLKAATVDGARALELRAGVIAPGHAADLIAIDLDAPALAGWSTDTLLEGIVFGAGNDVIAETYVAGERRA